VAFWDRGTGQEAVSGGAAVADFWLRLWPGMRRSLPLGTLGELGVEAAEQAMPLAVFDIQHRGKPGRWADRGAVAFGLEDVDLTHRYALAADKRLRAAEWDCCILADGHYADRWAGADAYGAQVYVACHVDGGGGDRGTAFFDARSARGPKLAEVVAEALRKVVPWPVLPRPTVAGDRALNTIHGVRAVALCFEPGFVDDPFEEHRKLLVTQAEVLGAALARGNGAWGRLPTTATWAPAPATPTSP